jgi:hypothetical protein
MTAAIARWESRVRDEQNRGGVLGVSHGLRTENDTEGSPRAPAKRSHSHRVNYGHILHETSSRVLVGHKAIRGAAHGPLVNVDFSSPP